MIKKVHVKKGEKVIVISGTSKDVIGEVLEVSPKEGKVIVKGANIVTKHVKPRREGEQGGIVKVEGAMYADKVMAYCDKCKKGVRTKVTVTEDGSKIVKTKVCAKCGSKLYEVSSKTKKEG